MHALNPVTFHVAPHRSRDGAEIFANDDGLVTRGLERKDGELYNVEFATIPNVKDPVKAAKSN